jgi:membrane fusion protein, heavy metal efflux system
MFHAQLPAPQNSDLRARLHHWGRWIVGLLLTAIVAGAGYWWGLPWFQRQLQASSPPASGIGANGEPEEVVRITSPGRVWVAPGSRMAAKLAAELPRRQTIAAPALTVTGSVVARLDANAKSSAGFQGSEDRWDFATPELATSYGDWVKSGDDLDFAQKQATKVRALAKANLDFLTAVAKRKAKLKDIGWESEETKVSSEADRLKAEIQGEKDIHEAETNVRNAVRTRELLERQLLQAGIDPVLLSKPERGVVLVVADVPETQSSFVRPAQPCEAHFFALPNKPFQGTVTRVAPSLSKERRTLRVIFQLSDPERSLLPGMFADVGLDTRRREILSVPAGSVVHVGAADYVLVRIAENEFRVAPVEVGELGEDRALIKSGVTEKEEVVGESAILLKPAAVQALQPQSTAPSNR